MRKLYTLISFFTLILFSVGCKTAAKLYERGDYDEAVDLAVKKLQKKPNDAELRSLLQNAYEYAVNDHETRIRQLGNNSNELKWEWTYNEYASLQRLYNAINRSPDAMDIVNPTDYSSYLNTYADKAAEVRFDRGMRWMDKQDKLSYRNAYTEFDAALRFRPSDFDIIDRKNEAFNLAVINVVVLPADNYRFRYSSYNDYEWRNFENDFLRQLQYNNSNRFVKFLSPSEAQYNNIQPDQFIDVRFSNFNFGRTRDEKVTREVSKEIVIKEKVYRPDSVVREYKKVYAKITTTKRTTFSDGSLIVSVRDAFGRNLWTDNVRGDHSWYTEFSTYTGDERALSESDKELINRRRDYPPQDSEIVRQIISQANNTMISRVRNYFSHL